MMRVAVVTLLLVAGAYGHMHLMPHMEDENGATVRPVEEVPTGETPMGVDVSSGEIPNEPEPSPELVMNNTTTSSSATDEAGLKVFANCMRKCMTKKRAHDKCTKACKAKAEKLLKKKEKKTELTAKCENVTCEALDEECTKVIHFSDECCPRCVLIGAEESCEEITCEKYEVCTLREGTPVCCSKMPKHPLELLEMRKVKKDAAKKGQKYAVWKWARMNKAKTGKTRGKYGSGGKRGGVRRMGKDNRHSSRGYASMRPRPRMGGYRSWQQQRRPYSRGGGRMQPPYGHGYRGGYGDYRRGPDHYDRPRERMRPYGDGDHHDYRDQHGYGGRHRGPGRHDGPGGDRRGPRVDHGNSSMNHSDHERHSRAAGYMRPRWAPKGRMHRFRGRPQRPQMGGPYRYGRRDFQRPSQKPPVKSKPKQKDNACTNKTCHDGESCVVRLGVAICCGHPDGPQPLVLGYCRLQYSPVYETKMREHGCHCTTVKRIVELEEDKEEGEMIVQPAGDEEEEDGDLEGFVEEEGDGDFEGFVEEEEEESSGDIGQVDGVMVPEEGSGEGEPMAEKEEEPTKPNVDINGEKEMGEKDNGKVGIATPAPARKRRAAGDWHRGMQRRDYGSGKGHYQVGRRGPGPKQNYTRQEQYRGPHQRFQQQGRFSMATRRPYQQQSRFPPRRPYQQQSSVPPRRPYQHQGRFSQRRPYQQQGRFPQRRPFERQGRFSQHRPFQYRSPYFPRRPFQQRHFRRPFVQHMRMHLAQRRKFWQQGRFVQRRRPFQQQGYYQQQGRYQQQNRLSKFDAYKVVIRKECVCPPKVNLRDQVCRPAM